MITGLWPISAGNAVRLLLALAPDAEYCRILRRTSDSFTGPGDTGAIMVADDCGADFLIDATGLTNGTAYWWRCYDWDGIEWQDQGVSFSIIPNTTYEDDVLDPQEFVRDRVQLGINAAIVRGELIPQSGTIAVMTAPFSIAEGTTFPCISVHLESTGPSDRGIGDDLQDLFDNVESDWLSTQGWLARTSLNVVGVSQNADERIQLRKVLRRIVQANLPVFASASMIMFEFNQTDSEQFSENNVPLYVTSGTFSCVSPAWVRTPAGSVEDVEMFPAVQTSGMATVDYLGEHDV